MRWDIASFALEPLVVETILAGVGKRVEVRRRRLNKAHSGGIIGHIIQEEVTRAVWRSPVTDSRKGGIEKRSRLRLDAKRLGACVPHPTLRSGR